MFSMTADLYDVIYGAKGKDYQAESQHIHEIIQKTKKSSGNTMLDVGCGTAVHLTYLEKHYQPEGLDLDRKMLDMAKERLPHIPFHQGNMTEFNLDKQFDVIISLFSVIGYVKTVDKLNQTLQNISHHTCPGGVVIIEPWYSPEHYKDRDLTIPRAIFIDEPELKVARMSEGSINGRILTLTLHYLISTREGVRYITETDDLGLFTNEEYTTAFKRAGLTVRHDPDGIAGRGLYIGIKQSNKI